MAVSIKNNIRFVDSVTNKPKSVPSLQNWTATLNAFRSLCPKLKKLGYKEFCPRHISQDPIENFFLLIRSHGERSVNLTSMQFKCSYNLLY